jgi:Fe-S-cluster-containing dehydrogenase component
MDEPYCVESCPTGALILADPDQIASGKRPFSDKGVPTQLKYTAKESLVKTP